MEQRQPLTLAIGGYVVQALAHFFEALQRGYRWTASSREEEVPPLRGLANRVDQATTNFLETFPFFAALVLLVSVTNHHSLGVQPQTRTSHRELIKDTADRKGVMTLDVMRLTALRTRQLWQ